MISHGRDRPSEWAVRVTFQDGVQLYYATGDRERQFSRFRGNAARFGSRDQALDVVSLLESWPRVVEVEAVEILNARTTGSS